MFDGTSLGNFYPECGKVKNAMELYNWLLMLHRICITVGLCKNLFV